MNLGIYIKFSSKQKKRQVVGILKKEGIIVSFLQLSSRLRYMKQIARKVKVGHTDLLFFNLESCAKLCIHGFAFIYIYIYIYIYKPKQKNYDKEENSSDGLTEAG